MTTPRCQLVDNNTPLFYHLVSRCVRRSWLCGWDQQTRRNYSHRKHWLIARLKQLGKAFAVDVHAYSIMSNHFHLVVFYDPTAPNRWSDEEVVDRWLIAFPINSEDGSPDAQRIHDCRRLWLADPDRLRHMRACLGSLSAFMKYLKQPIARRANLEDGCTGHFFEQRFYSGALLSEEAVIAAMAYVDLNPIRARLARSIAKIRQASITERLTAVANTPERLADLLAPVISGLTDQPTPMLGITLGDYIDRLEQLVGTKQAAAGSDATRRWAQQVAALKHRQRVFGPLNLIKQWIAQRGWQLRESPLP